MEKIKISLVDNDFVVHARAQLSGQNESDEVLGLIRHLNEDFVPGEGAFIEVEGLQNRRTRFAISRVETE